MTETNPQDLKAGDAVRYAPSFVRLMSQPTLREAGITSEVRGVVQSVTTGTTMLRGSMVSKTTACVAWDNGHTSAAINVRHVVKIKRK